MPEVFLFVGSSLFTGVSYMCSRSLPFVTRPGVQALVDLVKATPTQAPLSPVPAPPVASVKVNRWAAVAAGTTLILKPGIVSTLSPAKASMIELLPSFGLTHEACAAPVFMACRLLLTLCVLCFMRAVLIKRRCFDCFIQRAAAAGQFVLCVLCCVVYAFVAAWRLEPLFIPRSSPAPSADVSL
jgi:hypothetical protein